MNDVLVLHDVFLVFLAACLDNYAWKRDIVKKQFQTGAVRNSVYFQTFKPK